MRDFTRCTYPVFLSERWCIHSSKSQQRQTILRGKCRRLTFSFAPTLALTSRPSSSAKQAASIIVFRGVYTTTNNKNYQQSSWIMVIHEKGLTVAISTVRKDYKVLCAPLVLQHSPRISMLSSHLQRTASYFSMPQFLYKYFAYFLCSIVRCSQPCIGHTYVFTPDCMSIRSDF